MKLKVINIDGDTKENIELSDKIFLVKPSKDLTKSLACAPYPLLDVTGAVTAIILFTK